MSPKTLLVRARGNALVQSIEGLSASPRKFIGRQWVEVDGKHGSDVTGESVEVRNRAEYRACVREGSLWAADEATARECGVTYDPAFGTSVAPRAKKIDSAPADGS